MAQTPEEKEEAAAAAKAAEAEAKKAEKEAAAAAKAARVAVTVVWRGGSREYTRDEHGEDFAELAKEFAEKKNGTLV